MASYSGTLAVSVLIFLTVRVAADKPCAARPIPGRSVVCVCNETYCDSITRQAPAHNQYISYTSSEAGSRFKKIVGEMNSFMSNNTCSRMLHLHPTWTHQVVEGFGGSVSDSAAINWASLSLKLRADLVNSYFGKSGIEYNMLRVPIGGTDFSTHVYAYNEYPRYDIHLSNFSLAPEDFHYKKITDLGSKPREETVENICMENGPLTYALKIPMTKSIFDVATSPVHIVASTWSPPPWMKTNENYTGPSALKPEYYQTYADYHAKFIREYKRYGIDIWAITTTNEPQNAGIIGIPAPQNLGWTPQTMGKWIVENLGPTIKKSRDLKHVKIIAVDDETITIPYWFHMMINDYPKALDFIDGVGIHWYLNRVTSTQFYELVPKHHPNLFVISTEASIGSEPGAGGVALGDWSRAAAYINDIITDLNFGLVGWIDWNLCLDAQGGPSWIGLYLDSPVIVSPEAGEFVKQPMFYGLGHFSKWIPRGSVRISVHEYGVSPMEAVDHVAFLTPRDTIVLVIHNNREAQSVCVRIGIRDVVLHLERNSVTTVEFGY